MGHHQIVDLLLKRGDIDVNQATTTYGSTPFHRAAQHGDSELTKLLLTRKDVQVNASNKAGDTPLSVAVQKGYDEIVRILLTREDILVSKANRKGENPISLAYKLWKCEVMPLAAQEGYHEVVHMSSILCIRKSCNSSIISLVDINATFPKEESHYFMVIPG